MKPAEKDNPRSPKHAEAQRNRILDASEECFIKFGFHAASMARVAETAGISQGLAYRYFKSKSAIILAIIERQLSERHSITEESSSAEDYVQKILGLVNSWTSSDFSRMNPVLFIEMCSEASRDPEIQAAITQADNAYRNDFKKWMHNLAEKSGSFLSEDEINKRFYALQCLIEGTALLVTRQEQRTASNQWVLFFIRQIVSPDSKT
ncbi:TetR/AcrR family transcriptional regulator [Pelagicoccus sp. SDUM812002]|uniref:TetR/AcrR family transcriptional regulator n=1 Tax=Pelagicoccus sp. SDUM812002 TaxID=3041266 RepID=UPI00280F8017|nr:TetR/AcrR family transcriptional regulator [Pelagicoccus sp. SDUM812002]MDQ8186249.1 TetR/AcrR family transcriptional regulator [Pelagicoccus sp. SDUM812002]